MNPLEITLIIIGIIVIIISCFLVDQSQNTSVQIAGSSFSVMESLTEEDKLRLKNKMDELLSESSEEVIVHTDDTLSRISNEKIMAVNEFSEQILEKIKRNHEEVIFLYNMLNDKEKELKSTVREIDTSKKNIQDAIVTKDKNISSKTVKEKKTNAAKSKSQADQIEKAMDSAANPAGNSQGTPSTNSVNANNNAQILSLYSQGKSVMEISKLLDLGQGEVKLVIDLFKGKK